MQGIARDNFLQTLAGTRPGGRDGAGFCRDILQEREREREGGLGGLNHILLLEMSRLTNTGECRQPGEP